MANDSSIYTDAVLLRWKIEKRSERLDRIARKLGRDTTTSLEQLKTRWDNAAEAAMLNQWIFQRYMIGA